MKNFTITSITPVPMAREVNPYSKLGGNDFRSGCAYAGCTGDIKGCFCQQQNCEAWEEAENNLKEYELTKESELKLEQRWIYCSDKKYIDYMLGQTIQGEIIEEGGKEKIKVV